MQSKVAVGEAVLYYIIPAVWFLRDFIVLFSCSSAIIFLTVLLASVYAAVHHHHHRMITGQFHVCLHSITGQFHVCLHSQNMPVLHEGTRQRVNRLIVD